MQMQESSNFSFWNGKVNEILENYGLLEKRKDLLKVSEYEFYARHRNVLSLITRFNVFFIGILIAGWYYFDVWNSHERAEYLGRLLLIGWIFKDLDLEKNLFYGEGIAGIFCALMLSPQFSELLNAFKKAAKSDGFY